MAGAAAEAGIGGKSVSRSGAAGLRLEYTIYGILWPHSFLRLASLTLSHLIGKFQGSGNPLGDSVRYRRETSLVVPYGLKKLRRRTLLKEPIALKLANFQRTVWLL